MGGRQQPPVRRVRSLGVILAALVVVAVLVNSLVGRACYLALIWLPAVVVRSPQAIVLALERSGPVFVKLAQWLSTRKDILPVELCNAMEKLHEDVRFPNMPGDVQLVKKIVPKLRLGKLLGGGSIAQVFKAKFPRDGEEVDVAVKVRRKGISRLMHTDVRLLSWVARWAEWLRPDLQWLALEHAVDNFKHFLLQQVDFRIEAANLQRFGENFRNRRDVNVPEVLFADHEAVMVTTIAKGVSLSKFVEERHPAFVRKRVFELLTDLMAKMIIQDKFIHGDLHPGNVFVAHKEDNKPAITLIDAGISIEMSAKLWEMVRSAGKAAVRKDALSLGRAVVKLHTGEGHATHGRALDTLEEKLGNLLLAGCFMCEEDIWGKTFATYNEYRSSRVSEYFARMLSLLSEHKVRISPSLWTLMTSFALVEGSVQELGFGVNVLRSAVPYLFSRADVLGRISSNLRCSISERRNRLGL